MNKLDELNEQIRVLVKTLYYFVFFLSVVEKNVEENHTIKIIKLTKSAVVIMNYLKRSSKRLP